MQVAGKVNAEIYAAAERVYTLLTDFERYPEWYPGVSEAEVLESDSNGASLVRLVFDPGIALFGTIDTELSFERLPPRVLRPTAVGGRLKRLRGEGWRLDEIKPAHTRVTYELDAELDTGLPGIIERKFAGRARYFLVEGPVQALKERAETSLAT